MSCHITNLLVQSVISLYVRSMRLKRIKIGITASLLAASTALTASAGPHALSPAEAKVCKSVKHCADILTRHSHQEFDHSLLKQEFTRFGPKGVDALFKLMSGENETNIMRAQLMLVNRDIKLSPAKQSQLAALWPRGDLSAHSKIMQKTLSPRLIVGQAIETLEHEDEDVRKVSRRLLSDLPAAELGLDHSLSEASINRLGKAAISDPTPEIVTLLKTAPAEKTNPIFTRIIRSGHSPSVIAAYEALFEQDQKTAFQTLVGTLYDLKETEGDAAIALAALLRHRHKSRADGFYLNFAKDISTDPKMSAMGRLVGFDGVMGSYISTSPPQISDTPFARQSLKTALNYYQELPPGYSANLKTLVKSAPNDWLGIIQNELEDPLTKDVLRLAAAAPSKTAKAMAEKAVNHRTNYNKVIAGIELAAAQDDKRAIPLLTHFENTHPISDVRFAARQALKSFQGETVKRIIARPSESKVLNKETDYCAVKGDDFRDVVTRMPAFGLQEFKRAPLAVDQKRITSAYSLKNGWLVGYDIGEWGGLLVYFDGLSNTRTRLSSVDHIPHKDSNILAIIPVKAPTLGVFATDFWIVTGTSHGFSKGAIYRLTGDGTQFTSRLHARLPGKPHKIELNEDDSFVLDFRNTGAQIDQKKYNPPLLLSPDGSLRRACGLRSDNPLKALP